MPKSPLRALAKAKAERVSIIEGDPLRLISPKGAIVARDSRVGADQPSRRHVARGLSATSFPRPSSVHVSGPQIRRSGSIRRIAWDQFAVVAIRRRRLEGSGRVVNWRKKESIDLRHCQALSGRVGSIAGCFMEIGRPSLPMTARPYLLRKRERS